MSPSLDHRSPNLQLGESEFQLSQDANDSIVALVGGATIVEADPFNLEKLDFGRDLREQLLQVLTGEESSSGEFTLPGDEFSSEEPMNSDEVAGTEAEAEVSGGAGGSDPIKFEHESVSKRRNSEAFEERESSADSEIITQGQVVEETEEVRRVELTIGPAGMTRKESVIFRPLPELKLVSGKIVVPRSDAA